MRCKHLKTTTLIWVFTSLVGCASLNSEFNCPPGKGLGCKSIQEVNQLVNDGVLGEAENKKLSITPTTPPLFSLGHPTKPSRAKDQVLSVWIAPYEDNHSNYHDASTVHTVVRTGGWLTPHKETR